jgi:diguanylate cyclase (GGDEF)-like protein
MSKTTRVWERVPDLPVAATRSDACLVHIYPTGPGMGERYPLAETTLVVGRSPDTDVYIDNASVSRNHATIRPGMDGYYVVDHQSTNGTYINDTRVQSPSKLDDGDYLRFGQCIFRFLMGGNVEAAYHEEIYRLAIIDALTGIYNKRYFAEFLDAEIVRALQFKRPLALALCDIDHFKAVNDKHGHLCGDRILHELAAVIRPMVRGQDLFARYGGEEFALVLPETGCEGAREIAERMRRLVEAHAFRYDAVNVQVTISVGVSAVDGECSPNSDDLIRAADMHLQSAKFAGRNRVAG